MIGDSGEGDTDLLDNLILNAIRKTYARAQMRTENPIPLYSDLYDELQNYYDEEVSRLGTGIEMPLIEAADRGSGETATKEDAMEEQLV